MQQNLTAAGHYAGLIGQALRDVPSADQTYLIDHRAEAEAVLARTPH